MCLEKAQLLFLKLGFCLQSDDIEESVSFLCGKEKGDFDEEYSGERNTAVYGA